MRVHCGQRGCVLALGVLWMAGSLCETCGHPLLDADAETAPLGVAEEAPSGEVLHAKESDYGAMDPRALLAASIAFDPDTGREVWTYYESDGTPLEIQDDDLIDDGPVPEGAIGVALVPALDGSDSIVAAYVNGRGEVVEKDLSGEG